MSKLKDFVLRAAKKKRTWAGLALIAVIAGKPDIADKVTNLGDAAVLILEGFTPEQQPDGSYTAPENPAP